MSILSRYAGKALLSSPPPVIVVGMHRSGTSLLARLLEECGVHMGNRQSRSKTESLFFREINASVLDLIGCSWRCVEGLPTVEELAEDYAWLVDKMRKDLGEGVLTGYLGLRGVTGLIRGGLRWGWKDPRSALTLPLWGRVYPKAMVVHVCRDGRDTALSLMARDAKQSGNPLGQPTQRQIERFASDLRLWEVYVSRVREASRRFEGVYTLKYEDLLANPRAELAEVLERLGLDTAAAQKASRLIDPTRSYRVKRSSPEWMKRPELSSPLLAELGYD